jgi:arylsulfatase A-like enzyme
MPISGTGGGEVKSPNIDKLANEGVRLEAFYGEPYVPHPGRRS